MSILVDGSSRVLVQGMTGREGSFHTERMLAAGTTVVAGVTPGKGGQTACGLPVFDTVDEAVAATGADVSVIFVPARFAKAAVLQAAEGGVRVAVLITEGIPVRDMSEAVAELGLDDGPVTDRPFVLIGPNCPGIVTPGGCNAGIMAASLFAPGGVGIVSRSGTLTYEIAIGLTRAGLGQSTCVGMGGDPVHGLGIPGLPRALRGGSADRGRRARRRDRRRRRGASRRVRSGASDQAGHRLHRRLHGSSGQTDGPRRGDHLGFVGHRGRQGAGAGSGRRPRGAAARCGTGTGRGGACATCGRSPGGGSRSR